MKTDKNIINVVVSPEILNKLNECKYNKSKLVDSLLTEHFKQESEKKSKKSCTIKKLFIHLCKQN